MHPIERELFGLTARLSSRARIALAALAVERMLPLYRIGPAKLTAPATLPPGMRVQSGEDLIDLGVAMLWRYIYDGAHEAEAVKATSDAIAAGLATAPRDKLTKPGLAAGLGL